MPDDNRRFRLLGELFPNQFRSVSSIIIWTLVFLADVAIVFTVAYLLGIDIMTTALRKNGLLIYLILAFLLFSLESFVFNKIKQ